MQIGKLTAVPALSRPDLLAEPVLAALRAWPGPGTPDSIGVVEIDPEVADTAAFCDRYGVAPEESANCVIVAGRREGRTRLAACVLLASTRADVNNVVRRRLDARKASFAASEVAVAESGMQFGGITPIGLPVDWPVLVDSRVIGERPVVIGSGVRRSKLVLLGDLLGQLPAAEVVTGLAS